MAAATRGEEKQELPGSCVSGTLTPSALKRVRLQPDLAPLEDEADQGELRARRDGLQPTG